MAKRRGGSCAPRALGAALLMAALALVMVPTSIADTPPGNITLNSSADANITLNSSADAARHPSMVVPHGMMRRCGDVAHIPEAQRRWIENRNNGRLPGGGAGGRRMLQTFAPATINVYMQVIMRDTTVAGGNVPQANIDAQIATLNRQYQGTGFSFRLAATIRTTNSAWFSSCYSNNAFNTAMISATRRGGKSDLNLYMCQPQDGILGVAQFPGGGLGTDVALVLHSSLPGGSAAPYNLGVTATHEVGHWLGLPHTFQGGCNAPGDSVADTPAEATADFSCTANRDTCPGGGLDPIHNYMDYSADSCLNNFTPGQAQLMQQQWMQFRYTGSTPTPAPTPIPTPTPTPTPTPSSSWTVCAKNRYIGPETYTFAQRNAISQADCKAWCLSRSDCSMFTYLQGNCYLEGTQALTRLHEPGWLVTTASDKDGVCVVKPNVSGRSGRLNNYHCVPGYDYSGRDLSITYSSELDCANNCYNHDTCSFYVYLTDGRCVLKDGWVTVSTNGFTRPSTYVARSCILASYP